ncbi:hypothetical protein M0802_011800 [Mischocyttarus mexicanus]|nr:hypothetical protein M0802_011800 [Mischocyttarus mexicanus]
MKSKVKKRKGIRGGEKKKVQCARHAACNLERRTINCKARYGCGDGWMVGSSGSSGSGSSGGSCGAAVASACHVVVKHYLADNCT